MMYADESRGRPFGDGRYNDGWRIGIATGNDLDSWRRATELSPSSTTQMTGVAAVPLECGYTQIDWVQRCDEPIMYPELPWEGKCIEASALCSHDGLLYMFYGGAYNNEPQQIGSAVSQDGKTWYLSREELMWKDGVPQVRSRYGRSAG